MQQSILGLCDIIQKGVSHLLTFWGCPVACCWATNFFPFFPPSPSTSSILMPSLLPVPPPFSTYKEICVKHPCNQIFALIYDYFLRVHF